MPAADAGYRIVPLNIGEREILNVALSGRVQTANILALLDELEAQGPETVLVDESALDVGLITPGDIDRIARRWARAQTLRSALIAVVAPNPVVYGLMRMFQLVSNADVRLSVFWSRAAALAWLEASCAQPEAITS